jgi:hypothetical protein
VTRTIVVTIVGILLGTAVVFTEQPRKAKKQNGSTAAVESGQAAGSSVAVTISWSAREIEIIRRHYAPKYRSLPPGLQKKYVRTGQLPPGWQKKMSPLPASLERECAALPAGHRRGVIDAHAVIYSSRGTIIDVAVLF